MLSHYLPCCLNGQQVRKGYFSCTDGRELVTDRGRNSCIPAIGKWLTACTCAKQPGCTGQCLESKKNTTGNNRYTIFGGKHCIFILNIQIHNVSYFHKIKVPQPRLCAKLKTTTQIEKILNKPVSLKTGVITFVTTTTTTLTTTYNWKWAP